MALDEMHIEDFSAAPQFRNASQPLTCVAEFYDALRALAFGGAGVVYFHLSAGATSSRTADGPSSGNPRTLNLLQGNRRRFWYNTKREKIMAAQVRDLRKSRTSRATPARLRPHCMAIRKDLDPGRYPTIEALKAAIANGTFDRNAGARNQAEVDAMNKDIMLA